MKVQHVCLFFVVNRIPPNTFKLNYVKGKKITKWLILWISYWPVRSNKVPPLLSENHCVLGSNAVFALLSSVTPCPICHRRPRIAHSHWSSYHRAIFHISHIRSPYLSSSVGARHAKLIRAPSTCAESSDRRLRRCEIRIDFIRYSVFACNRIGLIPFPITQEMTWK